MELSRAPDATPESFTLAVSPLKCSHAAHVGMSAVDYTITAGTTVDRLPDSKSPLTLKRARDQDCIMESTESTRKAKRQALVDRVLVSSLCSVLQPALDSLPTALDPRFTTLLSTLVEAEGELAREKVPSDSAGSPKVKARVRFDFLAVDPPSPCNRDSLAPSECLLAQLGEALHAAGSLRKAIQEPSCEESELLGKQVRVIVSAMEHASSNTPSEQVHVRRSASFLRSELSALCFHCGESLVETRWSDLLTSLIRFELKQLLNSALALRPDTGNLSQNFEDAAALFHHALKLVASLSSAAMGESATTLDKELVAVAELGDGASCLKPEELTRVFSPVLEALKSAKGGWAFSQPVSVLWPHLTDYSSVISEPLDWGTVHDRLQAKQYTDVATFLRDLRLPLENAIVYNGEASEVGVVVRGLERCLEMELVKCLLDFQHPNSCNEDCRDRLGNRICDMLSGISAHSFCSRVLKLPSMVASVGRGEWVRLEELATLAVDSGIPDLQCYALLVQVNDLHKRLLDEASVMESRGKKLRIQLGALGQCTKRSVGKGQRVKLDLDSEVVLFPDPEEIDETTDLLE